MGNDIHARAIPEDARICIVMPTYNEVYNIEKVLDLIYTQARIEAPELTVKVLVVDDNSPDGTAGVVREYSIRNPDVHLLLRFRKEGLGKAYIAGMQHALERFDPHIVFEMDADLSHDPADIYRMVKEIRAGADCVIGSRYVEGGSVPDEWGAHRKLTSNAANLATQLILGTSDVKDCSGGFRAIRASILRRIDIGNLNVRGYAFQAVILEEILHKGGIVREIPISFKDRELGTSKMSMQDIVEGFTTLARVRIERITERFSEEATA